MIKLPPRQQDLAPHSPFLPNSHQSEHAAYKVLGSVIPCFWFAEGHTTPTELEGKQDHDLVVRDLILVCADYQGLLRLNKCWIKTRHFTTTSPLVVLCREAVACAVPVQNLIWETWAASGQRIKLQGILVFCCG